VLQPHGSAAITAARGKPLAKRAFMAMWGDRTLAHAAAILYGSEEERGILLEAGAPEDRLVLSPPPLELPDVAGVEKASEPTVAFLGRLDPIKGIDRLLRAVALARREIPALRLEILGSGEREQARLQALAAELEITPAVRFRGMVLGQEKFDALASAHVFCLLSHSEGLPVAAVEAMACGTPAVLSEGCHLGEAHDRAGVVVPGAPDGAAAAIVSLLRDDERRARLAAGALEFADRFRADRVTQELAALLDSLATSPLARKP
jgi:glycosyltransferase involved in cell wall biosynthesis